MGVLNWKGARNRNKYSFREDRLLQRGTLIERRVLKQIIMALHIFGFPAVETILFFRF